jgi:sugar lactone lactonase YvrE
MASKQQAQAAERPVVRSITPESAISGGELQIRGAGLARSGRPVVTIGDQPAHLIVASDSYIVARVPESAVIGEVVVSAGSATSDPSPVVVGVQVADSLHPVANPAVDRDGNLYSTFSNSRGQKSPVSLYKIDTNYNSKPFVTDLTNPTGLAFDREGVLYVSSRYDGIVYQITPTGSMSSFVEGMGVATGIAFDHEGNLYVGDRSGTIFKISPSRQIYVFATLEASIAAYHLAFGPEDYLYVAGPTTSSFDPIYRISKAGEVEIFLRGIGRPQGMAFDADGRLYVAGSIRGRRGIHRIERDGKPDLFLSGPGIVGLAFTPSRSLIVATQSSLYRADVDVKGRPLP